MNIPSYVRLVAIAPFLLAAMEEKMAAALVTISTPGNTISAGVDEGASSYQVALGNPAWVFGGSFAAPLTGTTTDKGADPVGAYQQLTFSWRDGHRPMTGRIRLYADSSLVLFSDTCATATEAPPAAFPSFTRLPANLSTFSYGPYAFSPARFVPNELSTPWLLFNDRTDALVISPATNFFVASMLGDARQRLASGFNTNFHNAPAGFTHQTLMAFGHGINRTWDAWGRGMVALSGAKRPASDADVTLKYLGYWTDNGAAYYYNYDLAKGYAGTLQLLTQRYREEQIPIRYLELDSWWYSKSFIDAEGKTGTTKNKNLPAGEWNRAGGLLEYKAHKALFPEGLASFQRSVRLPLVAHNRWLDPASPYRKLYKASGLAAMDPKWWAEIATYVNASGFTAYEQDWLDRIFKYSPAFTSDLGVGEEYLDNMARACREKGITMQYSMPLPCHFLQGSCYDNLTTIRTAGDRLGPGRWGDFLYTSRLAASLGIWPWADVCCSGETNNLLLATLSAGPVGIGDALGDEVPANLLLAVRTDGVIVKPDAPLLPLDRCYISDAVMSGAPLIASTYTDHRGIRTAYVFATDRRQIGGHGVQFTAAELGFKEPVCICDRATGNVRFLEPGTTFSASIARDKPPFYEIAPVGRSGIAFLGDLDKFVATGKQRIASLQDEPGKLTAGVTFAATEKSVTLHGYAYDAPRVSAKSGRAAEVQFDPETRHFSVEISPDAALPTDNSGVDPVRKMTVVFESTVK